MFFLKQTKQHGVIFVTLHELAWVICLSPGTFLGANTVTARAASVSHSRINLGSNISPLLCKCVKGASAQHPHSHSVCPGSRLHYRLWKTKDTWGAHWAYWRGEQTLSHDSWACRQRKLGYWCLRSNFSRQAHNYRVKNVEIRMKSFV